MFRPRRTKPEKKPQEEATKKLRQKIASKMDQMVKSKEWLQLYGTLQTHVEALKEKFGKAPKLSKKMDMQQLQKLYADIHADKYGHL